MVINRGCLLFSSNILLQMHPSNVNQEVASSLPSLTHSQWNSRSTRDFRTFLKQMTQHWIHVTPILKKHKLKWSKMGTGWHRKWHIKTDINLLLLLAAWQLLKADTYYRGMTHSKHPLPARQIVASVKTAVKLQPQLRASAGLVRTVLGWKLKVNLERRSKFPESITGRT